jgi:serine/threonine protein kinase
MIEEGAAPIDRYVVLEHLSEGGMGAIYVGKKLGAGGFEMEVVLKQLLPEFTQQEEFIELFLREAKLSATLDHANIVHTIDLVTAGGEFFIVMEYLPGGDLRTLLKRAKRRGHRFSPSAGIYIGREVAAALSYAHAKRDVDGAPLKLIHRDVSPSNILLSTSGEVKLTDFGIAKAATHNSLFYKVKGKVGYMSPEQARSEALDHRSDLYSLAVCLYEVLSGERLFVHAGLTTSADEIYAQPVPPLSRKVPGLPADLDKLMAKALAISPDARFQTAGELQEALTRLAHRNGLLMSAPELARELVVQCGPTTAWRDDEEEADGGDEPRPGTEVYDAAADDDDDDEEDRGGGDSGPVSIHGLASRASSRPRPAVEVGRLQKMALTSVINMLETQHAGAEPLVDLDGPAFAARAPAPTGAAPLVDLDGPAFAARELGTATPTPGSATPAPAPRLPSLGPSLGGPTGPAPVVHRARGLRPWMVVVAILAVGGVIATIVGMSGPELAPRHAPRAP